MTHFIEQKAEPVNQFTNPLKKIEWCARTCTRSRDRITEDSAKSFVTNLWELGHGSVFEHAVLKLPFADYMMLYELLLTYPYGMKERVIKTADYVYINARDYLAIGGTIDKLETLELDTEQSRTVECRTCISTSRELIRSRDMSYTEESTRYCAYKDLDLIRPTWMWWAHELDKEDPKRELQKSILTNYLDGLDVLEAKYKKALDLGMKPQEARELLPLCTATTIVVTGTKKQWEHVFKLRTAPSAAPSIQELMQKVKATDEAYFNGL